MSALLRKLPLHRVLSRRAVLATKAIPNLAINQVSNRQLSILGNASPTKINFMPNMISKRYLAVTTEPLESLGDSITTAVLLSWSKVPGQAIKEDDVIAVVETDKVTMDIRAKKSGVFVKGCVEAGAEISVGADLYSMDSEGVAKANVAAPTPSTPASAPSSGSSAASSGEKISVPVPVMGESITQGVLAKWTAKKGSYVQMDEVVASIETDKVTVDVRSPAAGTIDETFADEGSEVNVGIPLFSLITGGTAPAKVSAPTPVPETKSVAAPAKSTSAPVAAPSTPKAAPAKAAAAPATPAKSKGGDRSETRVKMTRMRLRISERLKSAQNTAAMLTTFQEVDMSNLINMRNKYKDEFEKVHGIKLGFMSAFVKASTFALQEIPAVNGVIDDSTNEIIYRNYVDVSVAVASPNGLVVPVLRNTEGMSFVDIEKSIAAYGKKAKEGSLALEDMAGGSFTISNGGIFGSLMGTPIINPPQSAILGMHATKMRPVVVDGQIVARPMMYVALTYDHRLIDGREAVTFLKSIQNKIEDPSRLLLDL